MDAEQQEAGHADGDEPSRSTEEFLEALLVDDAAVTWDPVTGEPQVERRPKPPLDRPPGTP